MLDYSSSVEGVIWSFCREVFPWDFHFHPVDSALSVEKNSYSSIYSNTIGKMITHTHTDKHRHTDRQTDKQQTLLLKTGPVWASLENIIILI